MARSKQQIIEEYLRQIKGLNREAQRSQRFTQLLTELFGSDDEFVQEYIQGLEHSLKAEDTDHVLRGRADSLLHNIIVEFEVNIPRKQDEAESQLRKYVAIQWKNEGPLDRRPYLCIATDGERFIAYSPSLKGRSPENLKAQHIELNLVEEVDWNNIEHTEVLYWLDRFLLRRERHAPTTEKIVKDFGALSHAFLTAKHELLTLWKTLKPKSNYAVMYQNWDKYLRIVYGEKVAGDDLFIRHTYLATLAKLMAWIKIEEAGTPSDPEAIRSLLSGEWFKGRGIENFLEEDFFSWPSRPEASEASFRIVRQLFSLLDKYDFGKLSEDVLKSLYQELVDPETRHDLGEFYTPDWLAHLIVSTFMDQNDRGKFLDPACGSGTFLYLTIREKLSRLGTRNRTLNHILESVSGADIHPLAVIIAKLNYLLALGPLVKKAKDAISIPIYLCDMLKLPEYIVETTLEVNDGVLENSLPGYYFFLENTRIEVPEILIESSPVFDEAIELCKVFAQGNKNDTTSSEKFQQFLSGRDYVLADDKVVLVYLFKIMNILKDYIEDDRDTIWAFVLKNSYKPLFLRKRFDYVIGNPPWIVLRSLEPKYQEFLKSKVANVGSYNLLTGRPELLTHLEVGTFFLLRAADLYLKHGGGIGFVLPKGIFSADQHDGLRKRDYKFVADPDYKLSWKELWDCENVDPLFNVPCSVVIAEKQKLAGPDVSLAPIPGKVFSGELARKNSSLADAKIDLAVEDVLFNLHRRGRRSYWSTEPATTFGEPSVYKNRFSSGACIYPRGFWFVETVQSRLGVVPPRPLLRTDRRAKNVAKPAYKNLDMQGNMERQFLYATLLSSDLVPFGYLGFRLVVLPIVPSGSKYRILTAAEAHDGGSYGLAEWLDAVEEEWQKRRSAKAGRENSLEWLDYRGKLTKQNPKSRFWVLYNTSGTYISAAIVTREAVTQSVNSSYLPNGFLADYMTYHHTPKTKSECHFLVSVLNAGIVDRLLKPMQARGLWGPRHICGKVLELPIPDFESENPVHRELVKLGRRCTTKVERWLTQGGQGKLKSIGKIRGIVRDFLKPELSKIDRLVTELLKL